MSWITGYKQKVATEDPRETKRKKLEFDRQKRAQDRAARQAQLQAALKACKEADQAFKDLCEIAPDLFEGEVPNQEVSEDILDEEEIVMADFEDENGTDGDKALDQLKSVQCPFSKDDIEFWFSQLETQLTVIEIKSQWIKRIALQRLLPIEIQQEVKTLLKLQKGAAGNDIYKRLKTKLIKIYGQKPEDAYIKATNMVMTGNPSQLGEALLEKICDKSSKLDGCCCAKTVWGMYREKIPIVIRNHIAKETFDKDSYARIFETSDQVWASNQGSEPPGMDKTVAAVSTSKSSSSSDPEVAAISKNRNSNRSNQGNQSGRQSNQNGQNGRQRNKGQNQQGKPQDQSKPKGQRHPMANDLCCKIHFRWGPDANYCAKPHSCPMKDQCKPPQ